MKKRAWRQASGPRRLRTPGPCPSQTLSGIYLSSGAWAQLGTEFGPAPPSGADFFAQTIDSMRVFEAVPTGGGGQENLLLVTTTPASWEDNNQGVLWGYSVCAAGAPQLRFAVSIGSGASGYTPTLDQANGLISLARLSSSVLIVSVSKAIEIWNVTAKRTPPYRAEP